MNKIIAANLKMNLSYDEIKEYKKVIENSNINFIIAPSNIYLSEMNSNIYSLCAQNGYYKDDGAYTGEVSFKQLSNIGVKYSLIGHSERRHIFNETLEDVSNKITSCIENNIMPILCVGETKDERDNGIAFDVVTNQIDTALSNKNIKDIIIAYEPVWSIGTGVIPTMNDISLMHNHIKTITSKYKDDVKVLYGGSVKLDNIEDISKLDSVDGVLVGGASLDPNNLIEMSKYM